MLPGYHPYLGLLVRRQTCYLVITPTRLREACDEPDVAADYEVRHGRPSPNPHPHPALTLTLTPNPDP